MSSGDQRGRGLIPDLLARLDSPVATYYLLFGSSAALVCLGLIMVLSASSVKSYLESGSSYTMFLSQAQYAVIGTAGAFIASRIPVRWWKRMALPLFGLALMLQALVFSPIGIAVNGNRNWISLGGQTLQPSELGKIAIVLLAATLLSAKRRKLGSVWHAVIPVVPLGMVLVALVLLGHDLGTALVLLAIIGGMLFAAGAPVRLFIVTGLSTVAAVVFLVLTSPNRMQRVNAWLTDVCTDPHVQGCYQKVHAEYALADGGWWGVGLGASREKWLWLPEAHNDFIFAIIGEELGLPGTLSVLFLFAVLAYACFRLVANSEDWFVRIASAGIMVWLVSQAAVNIGSVVGLLPVIGVPLPFVSAGGTALISVMGAMGVLMAFARNEPACKAALAQRPGVVARCLAVLPARRDS